MPEATGALVVGAASGIGRAVAIELGRSGILVTACDLEAPESLVREIVDAGGRAQALPADVRDPDAVERAVRAATSAAPLRMAVNAAGVEGPLTPTPEISPRDWHEVLEVNLTGTWNCLRVEIPAMIAAGGGAIVNCSSIFGIRGSRGGAAYAASKHGVVGLTRSAALEVAAMGVRINAVCPGPVDTPMMERLGATHPRFLERAVAANPRNRLLPPQRVADTIVWLLSEAADGITGQAVPIDDGMSA